jgi:hypothetical protein
MQIGQLWSIVNFFVKNNRLFFIRDAKVKMNQKKKNRRIQYFQHHFFQEKLKIKLIFILLLKNNSNPNHFNASYWEKIFSFLNYVYLKIRFSRKNFAQLYTKKRVTRAGTLD